MGRRSVSIYDIARLAGVSTATVSNVLNGKGSYSERTRDRVMAIARREGYVANFAAKSLREASTKTVGLITPDVTNDFFATILLDAEGALHEAGYTSYICNTANDAARESDYLRDLLSKQVDGIVYIGGVAKAPIEASIDMPVVHIDHTGPAGVRREVRVGNDMHAVVHDMARVLHGHGCERMACVSVSAALYHTVENDLFKGYYDYLFEQGIRLDRNIVLQGGHRQRSYVEAERLVGECLDAGHAPDGVIALGDRVALGVVRALKARGVGVGGDVRVIGMDDSIYSRISGPTISTVARRTDEMARLGVEALLAMMGGGEPVEREIVVGHEIVERESTLGPQG